MAYNKSYNNKWQKKESPKPYKPKRGKLAPLMKEEDKQKAGIHELSYDFACRVTRLFQYLTEDADYKEFVMSKQVYRSGTSVGANVRKPTNDAWAEGEYAYTMPCKEEEDQRSIASMRNQIMTF